MSHESKKNFEFESSSKMMNETIDYCEFEFDNKTISIFFHCLFTRLFWVLIDLNNIMQNNHHMSIMFCDKYANKQTKKKINVNL